MRQLSFITDKLRELDHHVVEGSPVNAEDIYANSDAPVPTYFDSYCQSNYGEVDEVHLEAFRGSPAFRLFQAQMEMLVERIKIWCQENILNLSNQDLDKWDEFLRRFLNPADTSGQSAVHLYSKGKRTLENIWLHLFNLSEKNKCLAIPTLKKALIDGEIVVCAPGTYNNLLNIERDLQLNPIQSVKAYIEKTIEQFAIAQLLKDFPNHYTGNQTHMIVPFYNALAELVGLPPREDPLTNVWLNNRSQEQQTQITESISALEANFSQTFTLDTLLEGYASKHLIQRFSNANTPDKIRSLMELLDQYGEDSDPPMFFDDTYRLLNDENLLLKIKSTLHNRLTQSGYLTSRDTVHVEEKETLQRTVIERVNGTTEKRQKTIEIVKESTTLTFAPENFSQSYVRMSGATISVSKFFCPPVMIQRNPEETFNVGDYVIKRENGIARLYRQEDGEQKEIQVIESNNNTSDRRLIRAAKKIIWNNVQKPLLIELEKSHTVSAENKENYFIQLFQLALLSENRNTKLVYFLLGKLPDLAIREINKKLPIVIAAEADRWHIVNSIINHLPESLPETYKYQLGQALILAAKENRTSVVINLLTKGASLDWRYSNGRFALHFAICHDNFNMVNALLENGADLNAQHVDEQTPNEHYPTPLEVAIRENASLDIIQLLLAKQPNLVMQKINGQWPIVIAAEAHRWDIVEHFLEKLSGEDRKNQSKIALRFTIEHRQFNIAHCLLEKRISFGKAMYRAIADVAIHHPPEVPSNNYKKQLGSALHYAAEDNQTDLVIQLLEKGATLNRRYSSGDKAGYFALHFAIHHNNLDMVKALTEKGADPNLKSRRHQNPGSPLEFARSKANDTNFNKDIILALQAATIFQELNSAVQNNNHTNEIAVATYKNLVNTTLTHITNMLPENLQQEANEASSSYKEALAEAYQGYKTDRNLEQFKTEITKAENQFCQKTIGRDRSFWAKAARRIMKHLTGFLIKMAKHLLGYDVYQHEKQHRDRKALYERYTIYGETKAATALKIKNRELLVNKLQEVIPPTAAPVA